VSFIVASVAQHGEPPAWSDLRAKNPGGMELSLQLDEPHRYREGELIRAQIRFPGQRSAMPAQPLPRERWQFAGFLLDPAVGCGSLAAPCFSSPTLGFHQHDPTWLIGTTPDRIAISLNNYLPALRPGHYRAAELMRKLVSGPGPMWNRYQDTNPPQYAISNAVEIETVPATEAWVHQAIASSVANLAGPPPSTREGYEQREVAAEQLRFLDTPAAWTASLGLLPAEESILLQGLAATREPARVCERMRTAVGSPVQVVTSQYLYAAAQTCARAHLPAPPPYVPPSPGKPPPDPTAEQNASWHRHRAYEQSLTDAATAQLAASLARKQGEAQAAAFQTLMEHVREIRANQPPQALPAWLPEVKNAFLHAYPKLGSHQRQLLNLYASTLRSPDMIPLLESVLDAWKPGDYYEAPNEALHHLYTIDPARAQARIVAELSKQRTWLDASQLELLPASVARITDEELIAAATSGSWNTQLSFSALAKYASASALPQVKTLYQAQKNACQPELMAYFVRVDPAYADQVFHGHPRDMTAEPPPCTRQYFERTPRIAMGPVLELFMTAYLMHRVVHIKTAAAQSLRQFGSPAAREPLWDAFRYFHNYWNGKQEELARNGEGTILEVELRNAIARARHWLATEADLHTIETLCVSGRCLDDVHQDLSAWQKPLKIEITSQPGEFRAQVAQYHGIPSIETLEEKLAQFPKDTQFLLIANSEDAESDATRIRSYAAAHGFTVITH